MKPDHQDTFSLSTKKRNNVSSDELAITILVQTQETDTVTTNKSDVILRSKNDVMNFVTLYSNSSDFQILLASFWPSLMPFIERTPVILNRNLWMEQHCTKESDLNFMKNVLHTKTLDQLKLLFHASSVLQHKLEIIWEHKTNYCPTLINDALVNISETLQTVVTEEIRKMEYIIQEKTASVENTINQNVWEIIQNVCSDKCGIYSATSSCNSLSLKNEKKKMGNCSKLKDSIIAFNIHKLQNTKTTNPVSMP